MSAGIQQAVCAAIRARGYLDGYTAAQVAGRQVCKLAEELAELAEQVIGLDYATVLAVALAGELGRRDFDNGQEWRELDAAAVSDLAAACQEAADLQVVLLALAGSLDELCQAAGLPAFDLLTAALSKAQADVKRGVRGEGAK